MSLESAKAFIQRSKVDEDFCKKVDECKDHDLRMAFVKQSGYEFTKDDIELVTAELSDGDLEGVNGGGRPTLCSCSGWIK